MTGDGPYVGLDCFREEDAGLFFGRDDERSRIIGNLRSSRLTLLHAESGVGKSSLLRAGVSARLRALAADRGDGDEATRYLPVVFSGWNERPTRSVIDALVEAARPMLAGDAAFVPRRDGLHAAIDVVSAATDTTVLVILDQFEEHFLYGPAVDGGFDDELAHCVVDHELRAHFLISVREDAHAQVGQRYKARIPNVYANWLHLDYLSRAAGRDAVVEPLRAFNARQGAAGPRFEVEEALVDAVLDQVRLGRVTIGSDAPSGAVRDPAERIETAYLQLVMQRLWDEEIALGSRRLRRETLDRLGGADTIVRAHLDDAMAGLTDEGRDAAAEALRFLITSGGRKIPLSTQEISEFSGVPAGPLEPALEHLERRRILRSVPAPELGGAPRRELFHDVLGPAVVDWRRRHAAAVAERRLARVRARTRRLEVRSRRLAAAVIALSAAIAALGLYAWNPGWLRRLELRTIDARFAVQGTRSPPPGVALVAVDDRTLHRFGATDGRLPREQYARIVDRLDDAGARVIAMDVAFSTAGDPVADARLRAALTRARHRVVAVYTQSDVRRAQDGTPSVVPLVFGNLRWPNYRGGYAGLPVDGDDRIRRANYVVDFAGMDSADATARTFPFVVADLARGGALQQRLDKLPVADRRAWDDQNPRATWIDFRGPTGTVPPISALDVLDDRVPTDKLRDEVVVVGVTARGSSDVHPTPFHDRDMPGAEIQVSAIATMMDDSPLRDADVSADGAAFVLAAVLGALAAMLRPRRLAALAVAGIAVALVVVAYALFRAGTILAVIAPLFALVLSAVGVAAFEAVRRARRRSGVSTTPLAGSPDAAETATRADSSTRPVPTDAPE